jgi:hypothetical protein
MKLTLKIIIATLLISGTAFAKEGNFARGIIGFSQGALNIGADYEKLNDNTGVGGYILFSGDEEDAGKSEVLTIGAMVTAHVYSTEKLDFYVAPGFGFAQIEPVLGDDESTFGPSIKAGVEYTINNKVSAGIQHFFFYNWMSDEVQDHVSFLNAAVTFIF